MKLCENYVACCLFELLAFHDEKLPKVLVPGSCLFRERALARILLRGK
jgi:hypothetical protein